jgi:hypothetical protein
MPDSPGPARYNGWAGRLMTRRVPAGAAPTPRKLVAMTTATIRIPGLKVAIPLAADMLPRDLVPPDGPAGEPTLDLVLEGGSLTARARLNGKNYRKLLKRVAEEGAENVAIVLQGILRPPATVGGPFLLTDAGFQATVKTPRPTAPDLPLPE